MKPVCNRLRSVIFARSFVTRQRPNDVGITWVCDREAAHTVVASARCAKLVVVSAEMVNTGLGKHSVVFNLALAQGWAIVRDQNQLCLALPQRFQRCLGSQAVLATLHDQGKTSIDAVESLGLLGGLLVGHGEVSVDRGMAAAIEEGLTPVFLL